MTYKNKKNGHLYDFLAAGIDCTNSRDGTEVVVYSPQENPHLIYVRESEEFYEKFELVTTSNPTFIEKGVDKDRF